MYKEFYDKYRQELVVVCIISFSDGMHEISWTAGMETIKRNYTDCAEKAVELYNRYCGYAEYVEKYKGDTKQ